MDDDFIRAFKPATNSPEDKRCRELYARLQFKFEALPESCQNILVPVGEKSMVDAQGGKLKIASNPRGKLRL